MNINKKRVGLACLVALLLFVGNYLLFRFTGRLIGYNSYGGECIITTGFGLSVLEVYPLSDVPSQIYVTISFDVFTFLITVLACYAVLAFIEKLWRKEN